MKNIMSLVCGLVFGVGLAMSGMTDTKKVIGFLDIFGAWVPDLLFVMGGAVAVTLLCFRWVLKRKSPVLCQDFDVPNKRIIDAKLIAGAVLFGVGWGVYGYCPGPALAAVSYLQPETVTFVFAMTLGMAMVHVVSARARRSQN